MFKDNINKFRKSKGLTQTEMAKRLHITRQAYNHYESGRTTPSIEMLSNIAKILQISLDTLVDEGSVEFAILTEDELKLLNIYRTLDDRGRYKLQSTAYEEKDRSDTERMKAYKMQNIHNSLMFSCRSEDEALDFLNSNNDDENNNN